MYVCKHIAKEIKKKNLFGIGFFDMYLSGMGHNSTTGENNLSEGLMCIVSSWDPALR